jgi:hypothetical protein
MPYVLNQDHLACAFASGHITTAGRPAAIRVVHVGDLIVSSQAVAACDPMVDIARAPFRQKVPNGRHRTTLAIANYGDHERVAFARVEFSTEPPVSWQMGVRDTTDDPATLGPTECYGYGVDSGTGCFMDAVVVTLLAARIAQDDLIDDVVMEAMDKTYEPSRSWADVRPSAERDENIICFSSGLGDGSYPSFFGFDGGGSVCQLVTDFLLFYEDPATSEPPNTKPWWQIWRR